MDTKIQKILFIIFLLCFTEKVNAENHLREVPNTIKVETETYALYELYVSVSYPNSPIPEVIPLEKHLNDTNIRVIFPKDGQQPSSAEVGRFSTPQQDHWSRCKNLAIWYYLFFKNLDIFEDGIPESFHYLAENPLGRALLYRICIEVLRVNEEGKPCFQDGTIRPEGSLKFRKDTPPAPGFENLGDIKGFEALMSCEDLFFKLLRYFHTLQSQRTDEELAEILRRNYGCKAIDSLLAKYKSPLFLFTCFGVFNRDSLGDTRYYPGDDLSLNAYRPIASAVLCEDIKSPFAFFPRTRWVNLGNNSINDTVTGTAGICFWNYFYPLHLGFAVYDSYFNTRPFPQQGFRYFVSLKEEIPGKYTDELKGDAQIIDVSKYINDDINAWFSRIGKCIINGYKIFREIHIYITTLEGRSYYGKLLIFDKITDEKLRDLAIFIRNLTQVTRKYFLSPPRTPTGLW